MAPLRLIALALLILPGSARADEFIKGGGWVEPGQIRVPAADLPLEGVDTHGRTAFHLTIRWTPADVAHVWHFDPTLAFQVIPGLAITAGVPMTLLAPQRSGTSDRFALGNIHFGVVGGMGLALTKPTEERRGIDLRFGGGFDLYVPTAPIPSEDRLAAAAAQSYRILDPASWNVRGVGGRFRLAVGLEGDFWGVAGELGISPSFNVEEEANNASLWITPLLRARVVLLDTIEPFIELGGSVNAISRGVTLGSVGGTGSAFEFQMTPGIRFHFLGVDPAIFVAIQPDGASVYTLAIDLAGAVPKKVRARDPDELDRF